MVVHNGGVLTLVQMLTRPENWDKIPIEKNLNNLSVQNPVITPKELSLVKAAT